MNIDAETQYQRLVRSYKKMVTIATDMGSSTLEMGGTEARDATQTFFNDCQTFKNWLKKDQRIDAAALEEYVLSSGALSLVVNLRHALEHALPTVQAGSTKKRRPGRPYRIIVDWVIDLPGTRPLRTVQDQEHLNFYRGTSLIGRVKGCAPKKLANSDILTIARDGTVTRSTGRATTSSRLILLMDGKENDTVQLAGECISEWRRFLAAKGIVFAED